MMLPEIQISNPTMDHDASAQFVAAGTSTAGPLRVLLVTPRYFPFMGGVENHVYQVAQRLARSGADVTVLTTNPGGDLPPTEQVEGVTIHRVPAWPANRDYYLAPSLYSVITLGQWDIIHIQSYHTLVAPLAMFAALRAKIPFVVTFHGGGHSSRLRNAMRGVQYQLLRPLLARATRLVTVAKFETEFFGSRLRIPREQFVFIPNGSDIGVEQPTTPVARDRSLIASVGRLERYKGHHRIIAALPYILEQQPDVRLWIAGTGPYESDLRRLAKKLNVADHVEIRAIPMGERERMAAELSKVGLVTLLSEYETHPIAAIEAITLGCPVLVADSSGLSELAQQGLARAISLKSTPQQVATAVLDELHQPRVVGSVELPTWDACAQDLLALYQTVTGRLPCVS